LEPRWGGGTMEGAGFFVVFGKGETLASSAVEAGPRFASEEVGAAFGAGDGWSGSS
jgi:hypothetical protein